jgi:hypothetical protein
MRFHLRTILFGQVPEDFRHAATMPRFREGKSTFDCRGPLHPCPLTDAVRQREPLLAPKAEIPVELPAVDYPWHSR